MSADSQHAVTHDLGFQSNGIAPPQVAVVAVQLAVGLQMGRPQGLPVDVGLQDDPVHLLDAPPAPDELPGQPVQQLPVDRSPAVLAQVAGGGHQAAAEVVLPDPIHHHPGRQGVVGAGDPFGQQPAGASSRRTNIQALVVHRPGMTGDGAQHSRFHGLAPKLVVAPFQQIGGRGAGGVGAEAL